MARAAAAHGFVRRARALAAGIAGLDGGYTLQVAEHGVQTPEAAAAKDGDLLIGHGEKGPGEGRELRVGARGDTLHSASAGHGRLRIASTLPPSDRIAVIPPTPPPMSANGSVTGFVRGVAQRLSGIGLTRTAAALSFTTVLGLVPLFTVAFVYVARYPLFDHWLSALERFLVRHLLPGSGAAIRPYLDEFTAKAGEPAGRRHPDRRDHRRAARSRPSSTRSTRSGACAARRSLVRRLFVLWTRHHPRPARHRGGRLLDQLAARGVAGRRTRDHAGGRRRWARRSRSRSPRCSSRCCTPSCRRVACRCEPRSSAVWWQRCAFEAAKRGFVLYVTNVPTYQRVYGAWPLLPLFLVWIFVSWVIVLFGAAVTATLVEGPPRGEA